MYIVFSYGLSIVILVMLVLYIFGGQFNLVVIIFMMVVGRVLVLKVFCFIIVQCMGGKDFCRIKKENSIWFLLRELIKIYIMFIMQEIVNNLWYLVVVE